MIPFSLVRWPSFAQYSNLQKSSVSGISGAFWTRLCRLLPANGTTWLIDSCSLLHISFHSEDSQPGSCLQDWNWHFPWKNSFWTHVSLPDRPKGNESTWLDQISCSGKLCVGSIILQNQRKIFYISVRIKELFSIRNLKIPFHFPNLNYNLSKVETLPSFRQHKMSTNYK